MIPARLDVVFAVRRVFRLCCISCFRLYLMGYALYRQLLTIAHCCRIADSWRCSKRILAFLVPALVMARLVPPLLSLGGPWLDPGAPGSQRKDASRSRLGFSFIFDEFINFILDAYWFQGI